MAPMVDVVFLLLCFFVTSQVFSQWEMEIDITLPTASTAEAPRRLPGEIILNVFEDGTVVVNGRRFDDAELADLLSRVAELFPGQPVLIRADAKTDYEFVIKMLDICRRSDIWNISFASSVARAPDSS